MIIQNITLKKGDQGAAVVHLHMYLEEYGYIPGRKLAPWVSKLPPVAKAAKDWDTFDDATEDAVRLFQQTFSLPITGEIEGLTLELMQKPRCGVPDIPGLTIGVRSTPVCGWPKRQLRYHIVNTLPQIGADVHKRVFVEQLTKWASIAGFSISEGPEGSDIQSLNYRNDGCGGTYAITGLPCSHNPHGVPDYPDSGDVWFDETDCWSVATSTPGNKVDFVSVALHELGHAMGLGHNKTDPTAVMYPYFKLGEERRNPTADDIDGIRRLYPQLLSDDERAFAAWSAGDLHPHLRTA
jgi:hypothetical protein